MRESKTQRWEDYLTCWLRWSLWPSCPLKRPSAAPELRGGYWEPVVIENTVSASSWETDGRRLFGHQGHNEVVGNQDRAENTTHHEIHHTIKSEENVGGQLMSLIRRFNFFSPQKVNYKRAISYPPLMDDCIPAQKLNWMKSNICVGWHTVLHHGPFNNLCIVEPVGSKAQRGGHCYS